jgi:uncharacterized protein YecA (UPF0149 family)
MEKTAMRTLLTTFVVLTVIMLMVAGCTAVAPTPASLPEAQEAVCTALGTLKTAVAQMSTITADTTIEEVQAMQEAIDTAVEGVKTAAAAIPEAKVDSVTTAVEGLQTAVRDVEPSDTLGEASASITAAAQGVETAIQETQTTLTCK